MITRHISSFQLNCLLVALLFGSNGFATENQDCLECHRDPALRQASITGETRSLYVDADDWNKDIHQQSGIKCIDCHKGLTAFSHPKEGAARITCEQCHPEACDENQYNLHSALEGLTNKNLPGCHDCHTKHAVRSKGDPDSTINRENIGRTCGSCHDDIAAYRLAAFLPTSLLLGHRKCDANERLGLKVCLNCHANAGHGPLTAYPEYCARCHGSSQKAGVFSSTHRAASLEDHPIRFLTVSLTVVLNLAIIGFVLILVIYAVRFWRR